MDPATVLGIGSLGASAIGTGLGAWNTQNMNKKQRKWNERMYGQQREDSLSDWNRQNEWNLQMWRMQNEYNSPLAQMQRFQEAGLNPHLIYGQGSSGIAGGVASGDVKKADVKSWTPQTPTFDFQNGINAYVDAQAKTAQTDNLRAQNTVLHQEAVNKSIDADLKYKEGRERDFDYNLKDALRQNTIDLATESLRKAQVSTDISVSREERDIATHARSLEQLVQQIAESRARVRNLNVTNQQIQSTIRNLNLDTQLKQADLDLRKAGMSYSDALPLRLGAKFSTKILDALTGKNTDILYKKPETWKGKSPGTIPRKW